MALGHEQPSQEPARHDAPSPNAVTPLPTTSAASGDRGNALGTGTSPASSAHSLKGYALTAVLSLVFGVIGAYAFLHFLATPPRSSDAAGADQPAGTEGTGPTTRDLSAQVAKLSDRVDDVRHRIDAFPKPAPPPALSELQGSGAEITKVPEEVGPIREAVKRIDDRIDGVSQTLRSLGDEVHAITAGTGTVVRPASAGTARPDRRSERHETLAAVPEKPVSDEALARGAELFHQKKYQDALDLFDRLEQTNPDDARVWYYAALAHGFAKNQWNKDGTGRLVEKGIERERAGTPPSRVIDETFKDLTSDTGKDWLAAYRKRVKAR